MGYLAGALETGDGGIDGVRTAPLTIIVELYVGALFPELSSSVSVFDRLEYLDKFRLLNESHSPFLLQKCNRNISLNLRLQENLYHQIQI